MVQFSKKYFFALKPERDLVEGSVKSTYIDIRQIILPLNILTLLKMKLAGVT